MGRITCMTINKVILLKVWKSRFEEGVISEKSYKEFLSKMFGG